MKVLVEKNRMVYILMRFNGKKELEPNLVPRASFLRQYCDIDNLRNPKEDNGGPGNEVDWSPLNEPFSEVRKYIGS